jgi:uncharacterized protein YdeI (YjbR/CyaY-like superfamily)
MNPKVDERIAGEERWQAEFRELRRIVLDCGLDEELKWGQPCYTAGGKNIVLIHGFKEYCALLLFKGALLRDEKGLLIRQTENVQAARQVRFTGTAEITRLAKVLKAYVLEAIKVEEAGLSVSKKQTSDFAIPEEFQVELDGHPALKSAFEALTPGRQRAYLHYFGQAKQAATRKARVEKCIPAILEGLGLDD